MAVLEQSVLSVADYLRNKNLRVPPFQRPYKWSVTNVLQLLDDIDRFRNKTSYRIGTIVICRENNEDQIVDGQQRTITFLLMLKALMAAQYDMLRQGPLKDELTQLAESVFEHRFNSDETRQHIRENYPEILRRMQIVDEEYIRFFLKKCTVTCFVIDDVSEAFQFFDSQNARGKDLEPHDLLKAFHLRENGLSGTPEKEAENARLITDWQAMKTAALADLFAVFLYRVRGWSAGKSARAFNKKDIGMFKGVNLRNGKTYPYTDIYRLAAAMLQDNNDQQFPFQLNQLIINGKYFFEMITHYRKMRQRLISDLNGLDESANIIITTINAYDGMERTGDKYVRMVFDCAVLTYLDRFGTEHLSKAVEKLFVWAWTPRLRYQNLQLASLDNYVIDGINMFRVINEAVRPETVFNRRLPALTDDYASPMTADIKKLFIAMNYVRTQ